METTRCGKCNALLDEPGSTLPDARTPCPHCGSMTRALDRGLKREGEVHTRLSFKAKNGTGRPFLEGISGASLSRRLKRWMRLERVIDRRRDLYSEVVTDPETGEEIHRCEEPLSQHRGHGNAAKR